MSVILRIIGLILLLLFLYFIESVIFLLIYGEGGQASTAMDNSFIKLVLYVLPLLIVGGLVYKMFVKSKN